MPRPQFFQKLDRPTDRTPEGHLVKGLSPVEQSLADVRRAVGRNLKRFGDIAGTVLQHGSKPLQNSYKRLAQIEENIIKRRVPKNYTSNDFFQDVSAIGMVVTSIFGPLAATMKARPPVQQPVQQSVRQPPKFTSQPIGAEQIGKPTTLTAPLTQTVQPPPSVEPTQNVFQGVLSPSEIEFYKRMGGLPEDQRRQFTDLLFNLIKQNKKDPFQILLNMMGKLYR